MHFETAKQQAAYGQLKTWVHTIAQSADAESGAAFYESEEAPHFHVTFGSTAVDIRVKPYNWEYTDGEQPDALIEIRATVVVGADMSAECLLFLLRQNELFPFGAFGVGQQNEIFFGHTLPMSLCGGPDELELYLALVASKANLVDEEIIMRWGGYRAADVAV